MNAAAPARQFTAALAVREQVPLLIGLMGPSGGGKTFSALRLGTGIQEITGGDICVIDTEARRALHYADQFKFRHIQFDAPFGSLDYLAALQFAAKQSGGGVVIVDSMSHEHEGPGGLIDLQDQEMRRLAGDDYGTYKAERFNMLAWQKPKSARRRLINGLLQLNANFIFCFRAKESAKPMKVEGQGGRTRTEIVPQGFVPIAGDEFVFEMTMNALLLPGAGGVPTWRSDIMGEKKMIKLPEQFRRLMDEPRQLDERMGRDLATWARGGSAGQPRNNERVTGEKRSFSATDSTRAPEPDPNDQRGDDGFPGDRDHPRTQAPVGTLEQRVGAFRERLASAPNATKAQSVWAAAGPLRNDLDRADPDTRPASPEELEREFNARHAALQAG